MSAAAVRKLAGEVMAFEEGLPADALGTGGPTWPHERRRRWRSLLETTTRLPDVSASGLSGLPSKVHVMALCMLSTIPPTAQGDLVLSVLAAREAPRYGAQPVLCLILGPARITKFPLLFPLHGVSALLLSHMRKPVLRPTSAVQIMAALIIVESAIKPAYLKPSWRLWAFPAPNPALAGEAPSVPGHSTLDESHEYAPPVHSN